MLTTIVAMALATQPAPAVADATAVVSGETTAVYMTISNPTMYDVYVMSATSDVAGKVELYSGDKLVESLTVAAYGALEMKAGGMFLRLTDMKRALKAGESIAVSMVTDGGATIVATAVITP